MNVERRQHDIEPGEMCRKPKTSNEVRVKDRQLSWKPWTENILRKESSMALALTGNCDKDSEVFPGLSEGKVSADLTIVIPLNDNQERNQ